MGKKLKSRPLAKKTSVKSVALIVKNEKQLSLNSPADVMSFGSILKKYIVDNNLSVKINGNDHAMVDAWKYSGMAFGLTAIPHKPVSLHSKGQYITILYAEREFSGAKGKYKKDVAVFAGFADATEILREIRERSKIVKELTKPYFEYECECDVVRIGDVSKAQISYGVGVCSNLEMLKVSFDQYSVNSMSQTRGIGKAYRNLLGFVMKSAGMEGTPAEEMDEPQRNDRESYHDGDRPWMPDPEPGEIKKTKLNEAGWEKLIARAKSGEKVLEKARENLALTDKQIEALDMIENPEKYLF
jgi:hypothetical protein